MNLKFIAKTIGLSVIVLILGAGLALRRGAAFGKPEPQKNEQTAETAAGKEIKVLEFASGSLQSPATVTLRGKESSIEFRRPQKVKNPKIQVVNEFPRTGGYRAVIRNKNNPHVLILVARQPSSENNFELRVFVKGGFATRSSPLTFDVFAVPAPEVGNPCNIVLITIDSLRPDHLGCYGYKRPTSPNLDAFAGQSVRFTNAFSTSSFTPPAHASLLTSRYVGDHGVLTWNKMGDEQVTLAEVLKDCGYLTAASVNTPLLTDQNLGQGFDSEKEANNRDGREIVQDAGEIMQLKFDSPFFMWLHFFDVHRPYGRNPDWTRRFNPDGRKGVGDTEEHYNIPSAKSSSTKESFREKAGLSDADLQFIADRYDAGIAYTDSLLGPLLAELSTPARLKNTLIIITADHGENLLEHQKYLFSHDPYLESVVAKVPLFIRFPEGKWGGKTVDSPVSLIDVAPTVMDVIGLPVPPSFRDGSCVVPLVEGKEPRPREEVFMECWGWEELKAIRSIDRLIIHDRKNSENRFYDLTKDPGEREPANKQKSEKDHRLYERLKEFAGRKSAKTEAPKLDPETERRLRSLGYVH